MEPNVNLNPQPAPAAPEAPAPQPAQPVAQPSLNDAPTSTPSFTPGISNSQPIATEPSAPTPAPQSTEVSAAQPTQPVAQPADQPTVPQPAPTPEKRQTYDEYLESLTKDIGPVEVPKASAVSKDDPDGLDKFFTGLHKSAVEEARNEMRREMVVQQAEQKAWQEVFTKYPEIKSDEALRDTVHNMRVGAYARGQSLSPVEAADALVGTLHNQYKKGINDTNVQTQVVASQPLNGGSQKPATAGIDYTALQDGGREAATSQLSSLIDAGLI